jgi:hypothetical protein
MTNIWPRQLADRDLEGRIVTQGFAVAAIRLAASDRQGATADDLGRAVPDPLGRSWVDNAAGQSFSDPEPLLDLGQHQHISIRGQSAAIEGNVNPPAGDR